MNDVKFDPSHPHGEAWGAAGTSFEQLYMTPDPFEAYLTHSLTSKSKQPTPRWAANYIADSCEEDFKLGGEMQRPQSPDMTDNTQYMTIIFHRAHWLMPRQ